MKVLTKDEYKVLQRCSPENPPNVGDWLVRVDPATVFLNIALGGVYEVVRQRGRDVWVKPVSENTVPSPSGFSVVRFAHYPKQTRDEAL
jgi:hypothetical protein